MILYIIGLHSSLPTSSGQTSLLPESLQAFAKTDSDKDTYGGVKKALL
jgi:hypothetical protein